MLPSGGRARLTIAAGVSAALVVAIIVPVAGELSPGAHAAVLTAGAVVVVAGLARRAGAGSPSAGRPARWWLAWLALALVWEVVTLLDDDLATISDLLDPVLASPPVRAAATLAWLAVGAWLVSRPGRVPR